MGVKRTIIYFSIVITVAVLLLLNVKDTHYVMVKNPELTTEGKLETTKKISLPAGQYQFIINYRSSSPVKMTLYDGPVEVVSKVAEASYAGDYLVLDTKITRSSEQIYLGFTQVGKSTLSVYNYEISTKQFLNTDAMLYTMNFLFVAILLFTYLTYRTYTKVKDTVRFVFFIMVGLIVVCSYPMYTDYLVYSHDLNAHLMRIEGVKDALLDGQLVAGVYPNCNNGFGVLGYTYPNLMLYPFAVLRILNVSLVTTYQMLLITINVLTAVSVYFSVRCITKTEYTSLMACMIYMLSPYRLNDLYIRGALGESLALIFLPIVLAGLYHIFLGDKNKWYLLCLGYTGVLQSHIITCLLVAMLSVAVGIFLIQSIFREKRWLALIKGIAATFVVNSFFLHNMVTFLRDGLGIQSIQNTDFYQDAIFPAQLLMTVSSTYTTNERSMGIGREMPLSVGLIGGISMLVLIVYLMNYKGEKTQLERSNHRFIMVLSLISCFLIFATTTLFPWKVLAEYALVQKVMGIIQFSFRFLEIVIVILAFLCGMAILDTAILKPFKKHLFLALTVIGLVGAYNVCDAYITQPVEYTTLDGGYTDTPLPEYWPQGTTEEDFSDPNAWTAPNLMLTHYWKKGTHVDFSYMTNNTEQSYIDLPLLYYRGYKAELQDGTKLTVDKGEKNRVRVYIPPTTKPIMVHLKYDL